MQGEIRMKSKRWQCDVCGDNPCRLRMRHKTGKPPGCMFLASVCAEWRPVTKMERMTGIVKEDPE
jgi:hypothetical protein